MKEFRDDLRHNCYLKQIEALMKIVNKHNSKLEKFGKVIMDALPRVASHDQSVNKKMAKIQSEIEGFSNTVAEFQRCVKTVPIPEVRDILELNVRGRIFRV